MLTKPHMQANASFGMAGIKLDSSNISSKELAQLAVKRLEAISDVSAKAVKVIVITGRDGGVADVDPIIVQEKLGKTGLARDLKSSGVALVTPSGNIVTAKGTRSLRATNTSLDLVAKRLQHARSTKIICTMGPACWSEEGIGALLDSGCDIIRLNFSHGDHEGVSSGHDKTVTKINSMLHE
jgi:Pyruvate kinase, barrel domain